MDDLCIVTVSRATVGPPLRGDRCVSTPAADDLAVVAEVAGIEPEQLQGRGREPYIVAARWAWWVLLYERGMSRKGIGRLTGRDHSSIGHALERAPGCARTQAILAAVRAG
jgi:chromosomal replication initiation ATPase DnaA